MAKIGSSVISANIYWALNIHTRHYAKTITYTTHRNLYHVYHYPHFMNYTSRPSITQTCDWWGRLELRPGECCTTLHRPRPTYKIHCNADKVCRPPHSRNISNFCKIVPQRLFFIYQKNVCPHLGSVCHPGYHNIKQFFSKYAINFSTQQPVLNTNPKKSWINQ